MRVGEASGTWTAALVREHGSAIAALDRLDWGIADDEVACDLIGRIATTIVDEQEAITAGRTTIPDAVGDMLAEAIALGYLFGRLAELTGSMLG